MLLDLPPDALRGVIESMPGMSQLFEQNPEARHLLSDPDALRQGLRLMSSPALMREAMASSDRALQHIESLPGGFNALRSLYETVQAPIMDAAAQAQAQAGGGSGAGAGTGAGGGGGAAVSGAPPAALPNPWAAGGAAGGGANSSGGGSAAAAAAAAADPGAAALAALIAGAGGGAGAGGVSPADFQNLLFGGAGAAGSGGSGGGGSSGGGGASQPPLAPNNVGAMADMLEGNPALADAAASMMSNPAVVDAILASTPALREAADRSPELRQMLASPALVRALMRPEALRQSAALQSMLLRGEPGSAVAGAAEGQAGELARMMQAMMGGAGLGGMGGGGGGGGGAMPGLDALGPMLAALGMGGGGGMGAMGGAPAEPLPADPEAHYASELAQLRDMGFYDTAENVRALLATRGNVSAAVERLLGGGGA
jgi:ubiquilin